MSVPESRPPHLTDAERQQLEELERRLVGQFPDLDHRFRNTSGSGGSAPAEVRRAHAVFAVVALVMVIVAAAVGGAGGALAVLLSIGGTVGILALVGRNLARARAATEAATQRRADSGTEV
ncbi:DUF3040 domain-containing protein [Pseudonocardia sp. RS010]|uniref:DUF3040 domain-containing protein n=1 Tax=Pseudonocardia sp. RS010 TaxID=3385979 RepID=UPI0039A28750